MRPGSITHTNTKQSCKDYILAWDHLAMFVEENVPDCFDSNHLAFVRQKQMNRRIWAFIQGGMDAKEIKAYYESKKPADFNLTSRIAYRMIFLCPWVLKNLYPAYHILKLWVWRTLGR
jgi:hypothetical protein